MMRDRGIGFPNNGADDQGWRLYLTSLIMILAAGLFVIARCIMRVARRTFGWDDAAIVASLASSIVLSVAIQTAVVYGYGMHKADLTADEQEAALMWFFIAQTPYKVTVCLNKVSVILLYLRIFVAKSFRLASFAVLFVVVGYGIGGIAATIWQCVPIRGAWDKSTTATCINSDIFWVAYAVLNIVTDVMVMALPIVPIMKLQLKLRDRILLCGVFTLGGFITICSIMRTTSVQNSLKNKQDQTYNFIERGIWTLLEANFGIINACLPIFKQALGHLFPRLFGTTKSTTSPYPGAGSHLTDHRTADESHHRSNPRFWGGPHKNELNVTVTASRPGRDSDEHHMIRGSDKDSSDTMELDERGPSPVAQRHNPGPGRISKAVEVTRTSFHEASKARGDARRWAELDGEQ